MFVKTNRPASQATISPAGIVGHLIFGGLLLFSGLSLFCGTASAQTDSTEQLQVYVERNTELVDWAREMVMETESGPARRVLDEAIQLHQRSLRLLEDERLYLAFGLARRSRAAIWHSVELAREAMTYGERMRLRSERFSDQHAQLMERALESENTQALDFLNRAAHQVQRAAEHRNQGNIKLAFQLLEQAEKLMHRAARQLAEVGGPERLKSELERTRQLIELARDRIDEDADVSVNRLILEAEGALERAEHAQEQGQPGRALQMAGLARRLIGRVSAVGNSGPDAGSIERQIERWQVRSERMADLVSESGSSSARQMYERSVDHRRRAENSLAAGELENALRQIKAAHDLLSQTEDLTRN